MWIINTKDGHTHQITNPDTSYEAWQTFLSDHYKMEDITALGIKLGDLPPVTIQKPNEDVEWFIEKVAVAAKDGPPGAIANIGGKKVQGIQSRMVGLVAGYTNGIYKCKTICYFNGAVAQRIQLINK